MKTKVITDPQRESSTSYFNEGADGTKAWTFPVDFISFVDIPDLSDFLGIDSGAELFMGIS